MQSVTETVPTIGGREIQVFGQIFLCTDNDNPQCPGGFCKDSDCNECTVDFETVDEEESSPAAATPKFKAFDSEKKIVERSFKANPKIFYFIGVINILFILVSAVFCCVKCGKKNGKYDFVNKVDYEVDEEVDVDV